MSWGYSDYSFYAGHHYSVCQNGSWRVCTLHIVSCIARCRSGRMGSFCLQHNKTLRTQTLFNFYLKKSFTGIVETSQNLINFIRNPFQYDHLFCNFHLAPKFYLRIKLSVPTQFSTRFFPALSLIAFHSKFHNNSI